MFLYQIGIFLYAFVVRLISPFHKKARKMIVGHKETYKILREQVDADAQYVWFHAASLGEFEQGRPIMETVKEKYPNYKILLTFFSPSGYEVRKDYPLADIVCYLPFDKKRNVKKFLGLIKPKMAIFIKYEFWYNFVNILHQKDIPVYMISAIFRPEQIFFKWYGKRMQKVLHLYKCLCVQDERSKLLLAQLGVTAVSVCGDTRFDRVIEISKEAKSIDLIERFADQAKEDDQKIMVVGSSWPKDEDLFIPYFNTTENLKLIIAPHEINESHLKYIETSLCRKSIRYSQASAEDIANYDCVIIDCFGLLSSIYRYGQIAYVGGGFGVGIHNILEAAVYSVPVIFGPNFKKFIEALGLIEAGGGYSVTDYNSFRGLMDEFLQYDETLISAGKLAGKFVLDNSGAADKVLKVIEF